MPNLAYLSLGSNVGDRESHLREAIARLETHGRVVSVSSFYETEPVEFTEQAWFLNCAVALETSETPERLMAEMLQIEQEMGRQRIQKKGPRSIDIDILLFGRSWRRGRHAALDHSSSRDAPAPFRAQPLAEIAPELRHPVLKKTIRELLDALPAGTGSAETSNELATDRTDFHGSKTQAEEFKSVGIREIRGEVFTAG